MKLSRLIQELEQIKFIEGDLVCFVHDSEWGTADTPRVSIHHVGDNGGVGGPLYEICDWDLKEFGLSEGDKYVGIKGVL